MEIELKKGAYVEPDVNVWLDVVSCCFQNR